MTFERVLVIGHNPGLEELIEHVTGKHEPLPTAALARINLPLERWSDLGEMVRGELVGLWRPKELKRAAEDDRPPDEAPRTGNVAAAPQVVAAEDQGRGNA